MLVGLSAPMFTYGAYKYGVCALKVANFPAQSVDTDGGEGVIIPTFTGLFSAFRKFLSPRNLFFSIS